ncbi:MAG: hypothetical protein V1899_03570, partial [Planctomycetota bacterium]
PPRPPPMRSIAFVDFFGGKDKIKKTLVQALCKKRKKLKIEPAALDAICGFGKVLPYVANHTRPTCRLPLCSEFEKDCQLITRDVFSLAAIALDIKLEEALPLTLLPKQKNTIIEEMGKIKLGFCSGGGGEDSKKHQFGNEDIVEIFTRIKALEEIKDGSIR